MYVELSYQVSGSYLELGDVLFRVPGFRGSFKLGFPFVYMFYTFKLLPQLKIGRSLRI